MYIHWACFFSCIFSHTKLRIFNTYSRIYIFVHHDYELKNNAFPTLSVNKIITDFHVTRMLAFLTKEKYRVILLQVIQLILYNYVKNITIFIHILYTYIHTYITIT